MLPAPVYQASAEEIHQFQATLVQRDPALLPPQTPKWVFLRWLTEQGYVLHGSQRTGIREFEPRTPHDLSGDEFSSRKGVFASSDALWAMMYALRGPQVRRIVNMALQVQTEGSLSPAFYYLSFAPSSDWHGKGRDLLRAGTVYVLPPTDFEQMARYEWPTLGQVLEPQWVNPNPVAPLFAVPVAPEDFPLPVRLHDADLVDARCAADPWGFPWLDDQEAPQ